MAWLQPSLGCLSLPSYMLLVKMLAATLSWLPELIKLYATGYNAYSL